MYLFSHRYRTYSAMLLLHSLSALWGWSALVGHCKLCCWNGSALSRRQYRYDIGGLNRVSGVAPLVACTEGCTVDVFTVCVATTCIPFFIMRGLVSVLRRLM